MKRKNKLYSNFIKRLEHKDDSEAWLILWNELNKSYTLTTESNRWIFLSDYTLIKKLNGKLTIKEANEKFNEIVESGLTQV